MLASNLKKSYKKYDNFDTYDNLIDITSPIQDRFYFIRNENAYYIYNGSNFVLSFDYDDIQSEQITQNTNIINLQNENINQNTLINQLQNHINNIEIDQITQNTAISNLQTENILQNNNITNLQSSVNNIEIDQITQNNNIINLQNENILQNNNIANLQSSINNLEIDQMTQNTAISNLQTENTNQNTLINNLQNNNIIQGDNIINLQNENTTQNNNINTINNNINTINNDIDNIETTKLNDVLSTNANIIANKVGTTVNLTLSNNLSVSTVTVTDIPNLVNNPVIIPNNKYIIENCRPIAGNSIVITPQTSGALKSHGNAISTIQPITTTSTPTFSNVISTNAPTIGTHAINKSYGDLNYASANIFKTIQYNAPGKTYAYPLYAYPDNNPANKVLMNPGWSAVFWCVNDIVTISINHRIIVPATGFNNSNPFALSLPFQMDNNVIGGTGSTFGLETMTFRGNVAPVLGAIWGSNPTRKIRYASITNYNNPLHAVYLSDEYDNLGNGQIFLNNHFHLQTGHIAFTISYKAKFPLVQTI